MLECYGLSDCCSTRRVKGGGGIPQKKKQTNIRFNFKLNRINEYEFHCQRFIRLNALKHVQCSLFMGLSKGVFEL